MTWICSYGVPDCPECKRDGKRLKWSDAGATAPDRLYFRIPYAQKEAAKALGAKWDPDRKLWYSPLSNPKLSEIGKQWRTLPGQPAAPPPKQPDLLDKLITTPTIASAPEPEYAPPPGSVPYDEFMAAIRYADEAQSPKPARERSEVSIPMQAPQKKGAHS